jgi:dTDP-4-dehydrorhamnose reductase
MKMLVTGAAGQLGRELVRALAPLGEVVACDRRQLDLADANAIRTTLRSIKPDAIINAAAWTAVDKAESEPDAAAAINARAPGVLAEEAKLSGALLIHYSTDYVFDGTRATPYSESDPTNPISVYGRTKHEGELAITEVGGRHLILRTSWVYGLHGANFMKTMLRLARERKELNIIGDQFGAPTWTRHLADATALLLHRHDDAGGLYHLTAAGETTWCDYATAIFTEARRLDLLSNIPHVRRITSADFPLPAPRPANSRLDCTRFTRDFGLALPDWQISLRACLADAIF